MTKPDIGQHADLSPIKNPAADSGVESFAEPISNWPTGGLTKADAGRKFELPHAEPTVTLPAAESAGRKFKRPRQWGYVKPHEDDVGLDWMRDTIDAHKKRGLPAGVDLAIDGGDMSAIAILSAQGNRVTPVSLLSAVLEQLTAGKLGHVSRAVVLLATVDSDGTSTVHPFIATQNALETLGLLAEGINVIADQQEGKA